MRLLLLTLLALTIYRHVTNCCHHSTLNLHEISQLHWQSCCLCGPTMMKATKIEFAQALGAACVRKQVGSHRNVGNGASSPAAGDRTK